LQTAQAQHLNQRRLDTTTYKGGELCPTRLHT
jgi:hypothetical protein